MPLVDVGVIDDGGVQMHSYELRDDNGVLLGRRLVRVLSTEETNEQAIRDELDPAKADDPGASATLQALVASARGSGAFATVPIHSAVTRANSRALLLILRLLLRRLDSAGT